jgi:hypothetical protein
MQILRVEIVVERFWSEVLEKRMLGDVVGGQEQAAETPRIVEAQRAPGVELDVDVVMCDARCLDGQHSQAA